LLRVFTSNGKNGKESEIAERLRERVCVRQSIVAIKLTVRERIKHVMEICD
jgi:hypothetical protein